MKSKFYLLLTLWTIFAAGLMYLAAASLSDISILSTLALIISLSPLLGLLLTLSSNDAARYFNNCLRENKNSLYYTAGGFTFFFAIPGILTGNFNPYYTIIFFVVILTVFGALKQLRNGRFSLNWTDLTVWLILWIPFDLRWSMELLPAVEAVSYTWWSITVSLIAVIGWFGYREADIGYCLAPTFKDLLTAVLALVMIMALVIPPGLASGFLHFSLPGSFDIPKRGAHFIGLFLTVALPEELFFRGILLRGLDTLFSKKWMAIMISSLAFGLMHWNNVDTLSMEITYVSLATIAGIGYGWAYQKSGNKLFAPILTHTLVDWTWKLLLAA